VPKPTTTVTSTAVPANSPPHRLVRANGSTL